MKQFEEFRGSIVSQFSSARFSAFGSRSLKVTIQPQGAPAKTLMPVPGEYLCANDPQADIVLLGGSPGSGFRFAIQEAIAGIEIAALGDDVSVDGVPLAQGTPKHFIPPFVLTSGTTSVTFNGGTEAARPIPGTVKIAGVVAVAAALLATVAPSRLSLPWLSSPAALTAMKPETRWTTPTDGAAGIKRVLARFDLSQRVTVTEQGKTVLVSGEVGGSEARRWQDALYIIRAQSGTPVKTSVRLDPAEAMAGRSIAGVAISPERFVVTRSGQRVRIGETLPEGWLVREIDAKGIVLERNEFSENINF